MNKPKNVEIGQLWSRPDGPIVKIEEERISRGSREVLVVPAKKGEQRRSWKWDQAVRSDFSFESK